MIVELLRCLQPAQARRLRLAVLAMAAAAGAQGLALGLLPLAFGELFGDAPAWHWPPAFAGLAMLCLWLRRHAQLLGYRAGAEAARGLNRRLGQHLARLPLEWFAERRAAELNRLVTYNVLQVMSVPAHLLQPLLNAVLTPLALLGVLALQMPRLALAGLAAALPLWLFYRWGVRWGGEAEEGGERAGTEAAARVLEFVRQQALLRVSGRTEAGFALLEQALEEQRRAQRRAHWRTFPAALGLAGALQALYTLLLLGGLHAVLGGQLAATGFLALGLLATCLVEPMGTLVNLGATLRQTRHGLRQLRQVLQVPPLPEPARPRLPADPRLQAHGLGLVRQERRVLDGIELDLAPGSLNLLVGASGAGKSSLLRLLARCADPDAGRVLLGGVDLREVAAAERDRYLALLPQDCGVLPGSLLDNLRLGDPAASDATLLATARACGLESLAARLAEGWHGPLGEAGAGLSGGERQRLALARLLLKGAPVLLLDEPTAALDPASEARINRLLLGLAGRHTLLLATHRPSLAEHAAQILVLDQGRLVQRGTHRQLLALPGRYRELFHEREAVNRWRLRGPIHPASARIAHHER